MSSVVHKTLNRPQLAQSLEGKVLLEVNHQQAVFSEVVQLLRHLDLPVSSEVAQHFLTRLVVDLELQLLRRTFSANKRQHSVVKLRLGARSRTSSVNKQQLANPTTFSNNSVRSRVEICLEV